MDITDTDRVLLGRLQTGDGAALETLFERHHGVVRMACERQVASADVDDCVQAVFLVLLRKPAQAMRSPVLPAWLLVVARHVCATARRAGRARSRAEQAAAEQAPALVSASVPAPALEHLDACLAQLPSRQRTVIIQHFLAGATRDEVAAMLGMEIDTVHQHCHRGIARLRLLLRRRGVVVPILALTGVLADQGHAAEAAAPAIGASKAAMTSAATTYASGAMTAMTLTSLIPVALTVLAVSLVGTAAITLHGAESTPVPQAPPTTSAPLPAEPSPIDAAMATELTLTCNDTAMDDVVKSLSRLSGLTITMAPEVSAGSAVPTLTMAVQHMRLDNVLWWVETFTATHHEIVAGAVVLKPGATTIAPVSEATTRWMTTATAALEQPVSVSFADTTLRDCMADLRRKTGLNILVLPQAPDMPVSLIVANTRLKYVLDLITKVSATRYVVKNQAICLLP